MTFCSIATLKKSIKKKNNKKGGFPPSLSIQLNNIRYFDGAQAAPFSRHSAEILLYHRATGFVKRFLKKNYTKIYPEFCAILPIDFQGCVQYTKYNKRKRGNQNEQGFSI